RADYLSEWIERENGPSLPGGRPVPATKLVGSGTRAAALGLDALLWSTSERVAAGSFDRTGELLASGASSPVEQIVVRSESLGQLVTAPRINDIARDEQRAVRAFQRTVADMCIFGLLVDKAATTSAQGFEAARSHRVMRERWEAACRAMDV